MLWVHIILQKIKKFNYNINSNRLFFFSNLAIFGFLGCLSHFLINGFHQLPSELSTIADTICPQLHACSLTQQCYTNPTYLFILVHWEAPNWGAAGISSFSLSRSHSCSLSPCIFFYDELKSYYTKCWTRKLRTVYEVWFL